MKTKQRMLQRIPFFAIILAVTLTSAGQDVLPRRTLAHDHYSAWVDSTLSRLTLEEKIGQMIQARVYGDYADATDPAFRAAQREIEKYHLGSVVLAGRMSGPNLSKGTPLQVANILNAFQQGPMVPLLVASDLERGLASRLANTPEFPFPMSFGATGDYNLVERAARLQAEQARAVGINWSLAPTADVNSNPENPIINTRSFGEDPQQVAMFVKAYIAGAHEGKILVTAKHFPGHGDASTDSHVGIVTIDADMAHLNSIELPPFIAAIGAGVDAVMPAHAAVALSLVRLV